MSDPHGHETVGIPMELVGVRIELPTNQPIVLLREADGPRYLPIWIGAVEATAIAYALEGVVPQRPLTHDLLKTVSESLGATVARVVVTELRDSVYYADLVLATDADEVTVSSRPSDAIALAARMGAPLFATPEVLDDAGIEIHDEDEEAEIEKFREFLDDITPEDFEAGESPS
jgi:bifunctional DNase/RNase